jgi:rubrerythrin
MIEGVKEFPPNSSGSAQAIANVRIVYAKEAEPLGSVPPPQTVAGGVKTAMQAVTGGSPVLFMDKLGERLAYERSGVRLYEALLAKYDAYGSFSGGPSRQDLEKILGDESRHFALLRRVLEQRGGDPTAVTPSADLAATMAKGITMVLVDPRVTLLQSLEAILATELIDNECWTALMALAEEAGEEDLAEQFAQAQANEQEHVERVRGWLAAGQGRPTPESRDYH